MATYHGNAGLVKIGENTMAEVVSFSITEEAEVAEDNVMGDTYATHLIGINKWTASVECKFDPTDTNGQVACAAGNSVTFNGHPIGGANGAQYFSGTGTIMSESVEATRTDAVIRRLEIQGNGALTRPTVST